MPKIPTSCRFDNRNDKHIKTFLFIQVVAQEEKSSSVTLIHKPECGVCGEAFEKYPEVVKHLLTHKETVFRAINCNLCNFFTFEPRGEMFYVMLAEDIR